MIEIEVSKVLELFRNKQELHKKDKPEKDIYINFGGLEVGFFNTEMINQYINYFKSIEKHFKIINLDVFRLSSVDPTVLKVTSPDKPSYKTTLKFMNCKFVSDKNITKIETIEQEEKVYKWNYKTTSEGKIITKRFEYKHNQVKDHVICFEYDYINVLDSDKNEHEVNNNCKIFMRDGKITTGQLSIFNFKKYVSMFKNVFKKDLIESREGNTVRYNVNDIYRPVIILEKSFRIVVDETRDYISKYENRNAYKYFKNYNEAVNFLNEKFPVKNIINDVPVIPVNEVSKDIKQDNKYSELFTVNQLTEYFEKKKVSIIPEIKKQELQFFFYPPEIIKPFKIIDNIIIEKSYVNKTVLNEVLITQDKNVPDNKKDLSIALTTVSIIKNTSDILETTLSSFTKNLYSDLILLFQFILSFIFGAGAGANQIDFSIVLFPDNNKNVQSVNRFCLLKSRLLLVLKSFILISVINKFIKLLYC